MSVRHLSKRQELDLYLQELAQVGGDVTKDALDKLNPSVIPPIAIDHSLNELIAPG